MRCAGHIPEKDGAGARRSCTAVLDAAAHAERAAHAVAVPSVAGTSSEGQGRRSARFAVTCTCGESWQLDREPTGRSSAATNCGTHQHGGRRDSCTFLSSNRLRRGSVRGPEMACCGTAERSFALGGRGKPAWKRSRKPSPSSGGRKQIVLYSARTEETEAWSRVGNPARARIHGRSSGTAALDARANGWTSQPAGNAACAASGSKKETTRPAVPVSVCPSDGHNQQEDRNEIHLHRRKGQEVVSARLAL